MSRIIKWIKSPNFTTGRDGYKPSMVCVHIMDGTLKGTDSWFMNTQSKVSSHYGIGNNGEIHQYVKEEDTAWTQGRVSKPTFKLYKEGVNPNKYFISIENEGKALSNFELEGVDSLVWLIGDICTRNNIPIDRDHIVGHNEINSTTKANCPDKDLTILDNIVEKVKKSFQNNDILDKCEDTLAKENKSVIMSFLLKILNIFLKK